MTHRSSCITLTTYFITHPESGAFTMSVYKEPAEGAMKLLNLGCLIGMLVATAIGLSASWATNYGMAGNVISCGFLWCDNADNDDQYLADATDVQVFFGMITFIVAVVALVWQLVLVVRTVASMLISDLLSANKPAGSEFLDSESAQEDLLADKRTTGPQHGVEAPTAAGPLWSLVKIVLLFLALWLLWFATVFLPQTFHQGFTHTYISNWLAARNIQGTSEHDYEYCMSTRGTPKSMGHCQRFTDATWFTTNWHLGEKYIGNIFPDQLIFYSFLAFLGFLSHKVTPVGDLFKKRFLLLEGQCI